MRGFLDHMEWSRVFIIDPCHFKNDKDALICRFKYMIPFLHFEIRRAGAWQERWGVFLRRDNLVRMLALILLSALVYYFSYSQGRDSVKPQLRLMEDALAAKERIIEKMAAEIKHLKDELNPVKTGTKPTESGSGILPGIFYISLVIIPFLQVFNSGIWFYFTFIKAFI